MPPSNHPVKALYGNERKFQSLCKSSVWQLEKIFVSTRNRVGREWGFFTSHAGIGMLNCPSEIRDQKGRVARMDGSGEYGDLTLELGSLGVCAE